MSDTDAAYSAAVLSGLEVGSVDPAVDAIDDAIDTIDATDDTSADTRVDTAANADAAEADADRVYQQQTDAVDVASSVPTASAASTASASSAASSARRVAGVGSPMAQKDATVAAATSAALAATFHASRLPPLPWHQVRLGCSNCNKKNIESVVVFLVSRMKQTCSECLVLFSVLFSLSLVSHRRRW